MSNIPKIVIAIGPYKFIIPISDDKSAALTTNPFAFAYNPKEPNPITTRKNITAAKPNPGNMFSLGILNAFCHIIP